MAAPQFRTLAYRNSPALSVSSTLPLITLMCPHPFRLVARVLNLLSGDTLLRSKIETYRIPFVQLCGMRLLWVGRNGVLYLLIRKAQIPLLMNAQITYHVVSSHQRKYFATQCLMCISREQRCTIPQRYIHATPSQAFSILVASFLKFEGMLKPL